MTTEAATPQETAKVNAISNLQNERDRLTREITAKQARITILDVQLSALRTGPTTTVTPAS